MYMETYMAPIEAGFPQIIGAGRTGNGVTQAIIGGDVFAQLFMQLLNGIGEDGEEQTLGSLLWLPDAGEKPDPKKNGLLEMLVSMMELNPAQFDFRELSLVESEDGLVLDIDAVREVAKLAPDRLNQWLASLEELTARDTGETAEAEEADVTEGQSGIIQAALPRPPGTEEQKDNFRQVRDAMRLKEPVEEIGGIKVKVLGYESLSRGEPENEGALPGQEQFRQAVQEARNRLSDKGNKSESNPAEILLGHNVRHTAAAGFTAADPKPLAGPGIPEQIFVGLSQNLKAGRGEFVVKLEPEGLGEITVKLLAKEGRTTLRIITASAETARLINNDLAALQNALKPIRVEVHQAVPETTADSEAGAYFAGFDQFGQFNQFNQFGNQGDAHPSFGRSMAANAVGEPEAGMMEPMWAAAPDSELDMYV